MGERRAAGVLEAEILGILWAADRPLTPTEVQAALAGDLAYNTVHTILTRLCDKRVIARTPIGSRTGYTAVRDATQTAAERMRAAMESGREPDAVLARFVTTLTPAEAAALRAALDAGQAP